MIRFLTGILFDRHGDIRLGWKIAAFVCLVLLFATGGISTLRLAGMESPVLEKLILLASALGATWVLTRFVNRKPLGAVGLWIHARTLRELGAGCLLGFLMMAGIYIVEVALGYVSPSSAGLSPAGALRVTGLSFLSFSAGAMGEELLFRGYAFQTLIQAVTFLPATLLAAVVFGLAHMQNPHVTALSLSNVVLAGALFSFAYMKTRSLWLPFGLHFAWNFSQTTLFGLPTSGVLDSAHALFGAAQSGPAWIGGGEFGPEGGVLATIALLACLWYILKAGFLGPPPGIVTLDSIEDLVPRNGGEKAGR
ncbi:MAG TPA: type II CAAX endopeptidase family protein [Bacteroidota bacterium]|nr:type II CAAX endopeptidase family protein [Bacteroidota bacterium]